MRPLSRTEPPRTRRTPAAVLAAAAVLLIGGCSTGGSGPHPSAAAGHPAGTSAAGAHSPGVVQRDAPRPALRPWNTHPASIASLGDSITRGFDACDPLADCPDASWATGGKAGVDSLSARLSAGASSWNLAETGARVADLAGQARAAAAHRPALVTVLIGANDACAPNTGAMTPVARFRSSFESTMAYLHRTLPGTQVLVASIPDLEHLWSVGHGNVLGRQLWRLGLCPSMLDDPAATTSAAQIRRATVRNRVIAYNAALAQVCSRYERCRYDGGAVFRYPFGTGQLSRWDWFHPNQDGQAQLARILAAVALAARP